MRLEGADGAFGDVTAMDIRGHELELCPPLLFDVNILGCTAFVVNDLKVETMAAFSESGHDLNGSTRMTLVSTWYESMRKLFPLQERTRNLPIS